MELLLMAFSWWLVGFTGAMMPGPVTTLVVTETAKRGFIAGPLITIGHVLLELAMVVALYFGLGDLLKENLVAGAIGVLGGVFLLWMGFDIVRSAWLGKVSLNTHQDQKPVFSQASIKSNRENIENGILRKSSTHPIVAGVLTSVANPYWILWWATVGAASLISFRAFGIPGVIAFYIGHTMADWVWNNFVAFIVATGRRMMTDRVYRGILVVCGAFLIVLSFYFVSSGVGFLRG
ncbi:MAG: LysE family transporter [Chloroflexi bacterium]|nr:LysE family transporter [Chloroflexota bacterium]